jgi:membrane protease YdiL (CAAX protease family)
MVVIFFVVGQFVGLLNFFALRINQRYPQPAPGDENGLMKFVTPQTAFEQTLFLAGLFGTMLALLWLYVWLWEKRDFASSVGLTGKKDTLWQLAHGALLSLVAFSGAVISLLQVNLIDLKAAPMELWSLTTLPAWMLQGSTEEIIFRGYLMTLMALRWGTIWGIIINSAMFAVMHGLNPGITAIAFFNLFLFGVVASFYTLNEKSLWGICAAHAVWNWAQGNLYGFEVSGQKMGGGSLFNMVEVGPDFVTGGAFGPEAGLAITLVLVVLLLWQWRNYVSNNQLSPHVGIH